MQPDLVPKLNDMWDNCFAAEELVLRTREPAFYEGHKWNGEPLGRTTLRNYLYGYNAPTASGRWGSKLQRIRLHEVDHRGLEFDCLSDATFANVRILVLLQRTQENAEEDPLPSDVSPLAEGKQAAILSRSIASLCVVVIGCYRFWVGRSASHPDTPKVWRLEHALGDRTQCAKVRARLSARDWDFVTENQARETPENFVEQNRSTSDVLKECNYVVLRRVDRTSDTGDKGQETCFKI